MENAEGNVLVQLVSSLFTTRLTVTIIICHAEQSRSDINMMFNFTASEITNMICELIDNCPAQIPRGQICGTDNTTYKDSCNFICAQLTFDNSKCATNIKSDLVSFFC